MKKFTTMVAVFVASIAAVLASSAAPARAYTDYYGAIALSRSTGTYGYSYDYDSFSQAEDAAVSQCLRAGGGSDCEAKISWANGCGAIALSRDYWSYGSAATLAGAKRDALSSNPEPASIEHWNCTSGYSL
ncbi:DUF4189 domain-containing protein [Nocardia stercoris]|uniref:DUF4189 domain-containing protein n=1 Tax=Nocardia stercoris TaxID=2483361 RepID=A0A3M2KS95_9NOCA|nr:DUF4189 domain-containing protein [Nocardia stercoris]RMI28527.1 DUF4189 domain-containing protein [Nocardia stercoris]